MSIVNNAQESEKFCVSEVRCLSKEAIVEQRIGRTDQSARNARCGELERSQRRGTQSLRARRRPRECIRNDPRRGTKDTRNGTKDRREIVSLRFDAVSLADRFEQVDPFLEARARPDTRLLIGSGWRGSGIRGEPYNSFGVGEKFGFRKI